MREGRYGLRARGSDRERGASLVEFAFVVPILAMFLFGIVQFGLAYDTKQSVNSGAREGARLGALETTTLHQIRERARSAYGNAAAPGSPPTVEIYGVVLPAATTAFPIGASDGVGPCGSTSTDFDFVRVIVTKPFDFTIPFVPLDPANLTSTGEFRCE